MASESTVKAKLGDLNRDPFVPLLTKLIGESKFVQNNPPDFIPEEVRVVKHVLDVLLHLSTKTGSGPLLINHVTYFPSRGTGGMIPWKLHVTGKLFDSGLAHKKVLDVTSNMVAVKVGGGPRVNTWKGQTSTSEIVRCAIGLPVEVDGIFNVVPFSFFFLSHQAYSQLVCFLPLFLSLLLKFSVIRFRGLLNFPLFHAGILNFLLQWFDNVSESISHSEDQRQSETIVGDDFTEECGETCISRTVNTCKKKTYHRGN